LRKRVGSRFVVVAVAVAGRVGRDASLPLTSTSHNRVSAVPLNPQGPHFFDVLELKSNEHKNVRRE
jgi:hypothetical protein